MAHRPPSNAPRPPPASPPTPARWLAATDAIGLQLFRGLRGTRQIIAFTLITLGVALTKAGHARAVLHPMFRAQVRRAGPDLFPMIAFLGIALGLVIIAQTVALLSTIGARDFVGTVMVTVVVRELGPLVAALVVLTRVGAAYVVELGTSRALGEVEALEALRIDPIHYLVLPRVVALALGAFSLTIYFVLISLFSGYFFAFLQEIQLPPTDYLAQLAQALQWQDFALLGLKTLAFGAIIAVVCCYHGLAQPIRINQISRATTRAVVQSIVGCVVLDAVFLLPRVLA